MTLWFGLNHGFLSTFGDSLKSYTMAAHVRHVGEDTRGSRDSLHHVRDDFVVLFSRDLRDGTCKLHFPDDVLPTLAPS